MPKKDPQSSEEEGDVPQPPPESKGAIPKSRSYAGPQASTAKSDEGKKASGVKSEDEGDAENPKRVWEGRTRSSRKDPEKEEKESFFRKLRGKSKSKSPSNRREKSKSRSPSTEDERDKRKTSPSPGSRLRGFLKGRKKSKSPTKPATPVVLEMEEDVEDEQPAEAPAQATGGPPISPLEELRGIMQPSATAGYARSMKHRPGPDMEELLPGPQDSKPLESMADQYKANLDMESQEKCIELKTPKGSPPCEEDDTASSSLSDSSSRNLPMQEDFANFSDSGGSRASRSRDKKK